MPFGAHCPLVEATCLARGLRAFCQRPGQPLPHLELSCVACTPLCMGIPAPDSMHAWAHAFIDSPIELPLTAGVFVVPGWSGHITAVLETSAKHAQAAGPGGRHARPLEVLAPPAGAFGRAVAAALPWASRLRPQVYASADLAAAALLPVLFGGGRLHGQGQVGATGSCARCCVHVHTAYSVPLSAATVR